MCFLIFCTLQCKIHSYLFLFSFSICWTLLLYIIYIRAGYLKYDIALGTLNYLGKETKYVPWKTALNSLGFLEHILSDRPANGNFQVCTLTTYWRIVRTQRLTLIKKNYWLKEKSELLNDRVGDYSQMSIKLEANNFFCIIAQVLSYSVINSFCCWFHSVTFVLITCIEVSNQFPGEFNMLIKQNKPETSYLSFAIRQT